MRPAMGSGLTVAQAELLGDELIKAENAKPIQSIEELEASHSRLAAGHPQRQGLHGLRVHQGIRIGRSRTRTPTCVTPSTRQPVSVTCPGQPHRQAVVARMGRRATLAR
jgi:hypothetical protein